MTDTPRSQRHRSVPSSRLARFGAMGGLATGLAGDMAMGAGRALARGERPRLDTLLLTPASMERIADRLSQMRGAAMKLGQLMSMETGDLLPPELAAILARLRDAAHMMPPKQLKSVLEDTYGPDFRRHFKGFDTTPLAAASIGQVHRATAADGTSLVLKIQYPGVRAAIDSDLDNAAALIRWSGMLPEELDLAPLLAEARKQLHEEADYAREGAYMARFSALLEHDDRFVVPRYRPELSAPGALAMSHEPSEPIEALADAAPEVRDRAMSALIDLCLRELFEFRMMQTDPNFANYRWRPETGQIVLLDFGATREIGAGSRRGIWNCYVPALRGTGTGCFAALEALGFVRPGLAERHRVALLDMAAMGFGALDGPLDFAADDLPDRMRQRGMEIGSERDLWHIPPAETLFLQRKIGGLYLLAARLGPRWTSRTCWRAGPELRRADVS
jgi:predicted unusual protein kinase regulating ubiquinone biosynthesis (AarF/ABC1/UbiB family)